LLSQGHFGAIDVSGFSAVVLIGLGWFLATRTDASETGEHNMHSYRKWPGVTETLCACALLILISVSPVSAQSQNQQIAQIKTVSGQVTIMRGDGKVPANVGGALFEKDIIETGADGAVGVTFIDNTVMSAGPNSEVALEEFKFDSSNFKGSMLTDLRKGTVSMVSGDIAKSSPEAMKVKTPTAILGVRGTRFVIQAAGAGN